MHERRQEPRARSMFKSAYVRTSSGLEFVTLRNQSDSGLCLDAFRGVSEGEEIEFCIDDTGPRTGKVRWVKDGLCGIATDVSNAADGATQLFPHRSVRLPISVEVVLYVNGRQQPATLHNISIRGACISSPSSFASGQLISLEIGGFCFELASIRWSRHGLFGLRFAEAIHPSRFRRLIERIQTSHIQQCDEAARLSQMRAAR